MIPLITGVGIVFVAVFILMAVRGKMKKNQKELEKPPEVVEREMQELIEKAKAEMAREGSDESNKNKEGATELFIKDGNILKIDDEATLEVINLEDFLNALSEHSGKVPAPHYYVDLNYKVVVGDKEYFGSTRFDTYKGLSSQMDEGSPYEVKLKDWKLGEGDLDKYLSFIIEKK